MNKKVYYLFSLVLYSSLMIADFSTEQGCQVPSTSHEYRNYDHVEKKVREMDLQRLQILEEQENGAYFYSKACFNTSALSAVIGIITGFILEHEKATKVALVSTVTSFVAGAGIRYEENYMMQKREKEKALIYKRLHHHNHR